MSLVILPLSATLRGVLRRASGIGTDVVRRGFPQFIGYRISKGTPPIVKVA